MITLAVATILHYFEIFTFHAAHYWACFFAEWCFWRVIKKVKVLP